MEVGRLRIWRLIAYPMLVLIGAGTSVSSAAADQVYPGPTPRAHCGPGSNPELGRQGRMTDADAARAPLYCNMQLLSQYGAKGGYKVERYIDTQGHECAFYDSTLLFPKDVSVTTDLIGTYVLDMTDPSHPVRTTTLVTPAMQSPHESMALNQKRGLLAAVTGNVVTGPPSLDVYDLTADCRNPLPVAPSVAAISGHEGNWAPDGLTYYSAGWYSEQIAAIDVSNAMAPHPIWVGSYGHQHGLSVSDDGNRVYMATEGDGLPGRPDNALTIIDTSQVQARVLNPQVSVVSTLDWPTTRSTPQATIPVTIQGHKYLIEHDEFGGGTDHIGAARIIDIADDKKPFVVSNIKLEVNMPENQADEGNDPGSATTFRGYGAHYCEVPQRHEPNVLACTFILSGLRFFDIRDPFHPREIAYFSPAPHQANAGSPTAIDPASNFSMPKPAFVPERNEIWFTDGNSGFYALRLTNGAGSIVPGSPKGGPYVVGDNSALRGGPNTTAGVKPETIVLGLGFLLALAGIVVLGVRRRT